MENQFYIDLIVQNMDYHVYSLSAYRRVKTWLCELETALKEGRIDRHMASGGLLIEDPDDQRPEDLDFDEEHYIAENQRLWNQVCWNLIKNTIGIDALREILEADLVTLDQVHEPSGRVFGKIFDKAYTQQLLEHFACDEPSWTF